ncbi:MAG: polysaccharide deacetylase family protein [Planctomycetota bacterium]
MKALPIGLLIPAAVGVALGSPWAWPFVASFVVVFLVGVFHLPSGIFTRVVNRVEGGVALTYDDGPDPDTTPALLDLLRDRGAKATFFVVGERARAHPAIVRRAVEEGHEIGNHSDRHSHWMNFWFGRRMRDDLRGCQDAVEAAAGVTPRFYRPPIGLVNHAVEGAAWHFGMRVAGWTIRSFDTVSDSAAPRVVGRLRDGAVVLLHDGGLDRDKVLGLTRTILDAAAERGLTTRTLTGRGSTSSKLTADS